MVLHSRDPALAISAEKSNPCARLIPGNQDCINQIQKNNCCHGKGDKQCSGKTSGIGADLKKAEKHISDRNQMLVNLAKVEQARSTGRGGGHLDNARVFQTVPFSLRDIRE
ncbi:MAG: hypothetical protein RLZZ308_542 [Candidatus Parcubacteria bacterium]|jgi:hypothetical protein